MSRQGIRDLVCGSAVGVGLFALTVAGIIVGAAPEAQAITCTNGLGILTEANANLHYGTGSSNVAYRSIPSTNCPIVRSLYITHDQGNEAEVGWYQDGDAANIEKCDVVKTPHILVWEIYNYNTHKCKPGTNAYTSSSNTIFELVEPCCNDISYYHGNSYLGFYDALYSTGYSQAVSEAHDTVTSNELSARFGGLTFYGSGGNSNSWNQDPMYCQKVGTQPNGWYWHQDATDEWHEDQTSPGSGCND